jgi:uncharacterized protein
MNTIKIAWSLIGLCIFTALLLYWISTQQQTLTAHTAFSDYTQQTITIENKTLRVWVADTEKKRALGLSNTTELPAHTGMLFIFNSTDTWGIWMKSMHYPIDVFWLDDSLQIVHSVRNMKPESYPTVYTSPVPARYVLETPIGQIPVSE